MRSKYNNEDLSNFLDFLGKKETSREVEDKLTEYKNKVKKDRP